MESIKKALRYLLFYERVNVSKRVNGVLYFLRKLPWLGKKIPKTVYKSYRVKMVLFALVAMVTVAMNVAIKGGIIAGYSGLVWLFDYLIHPNGSEMDLLSYLWGGIFLWLAMTIFINVYNIWFSQVEPKILEFMDNFHLPKKFFIKSKQMIDPLIHGIYYVPVAVLVAWLLNSWVSVVAIPVFYVTLSYFGYVLARLVLSRNKLPMMTQAILVIVSVIITLIIGILLPILTGVNWVQEVVVSPVMTGMALLVAVASFYGILTFKRETEYLAVVMDRSTAVSEGAKNIHAHTTQNVQKKMSISTDRGKFDHKTGNAYLNALLFDRYKKMFRKLLLFRLVASGVVILSFAAVTLFWSSWLGNPLDLVPLLHVIVIPMWIATFSVGRKVVQIVFLNCDTAFLHYPFYRTKAIIVSGFFDRLRRIFLLNGVLAIAPLTVALIIGINSGSDFSFMSITLTILISMLLLFSFHELFLYYMLQPFAEDMQVKSPLYTIITMASSMVIWFVIASQPEFLFESERLVATILAGITILYMGVGTMALQKFAPKTFRAKS